MSTSISAAQGIQQQLYTMQQQILTLTKRLDAVEKENRELRRECERNRSDVDVAMSSVHKNRWDPVRWSLDPILRDYDPSLTVEEVFAFDELASGESASSSSSANQNENTKNKNKKNNQKILLQLDDDIRQVLKICRMNSQARPSGAVVKIDESNSNKMSDQIFKHISKMQECFTELSFEGSNNYITDLSIHHLGEFQKLLSLNVSGIDCITSDLLHQVLKNCPNMHHLKASGCKNLLTSKPFQLPNLQLRTLNLDQVSGTSDEWLGLIVQNCKDLEEIRLVGCSRITKQGLLEHLPYLPKLKKYVINQALANDPELRTIARKV